MLRFLRRNHTYVCAMLFALHILWLQEIQCICRLSVLSRFDSVMLFLCICLFPLDLIDVLHYGTVRERAHDQY